MAITFCREYLSDPTIFLLVSFCRFSVEFRMNGNTEKQQRNDSNPVTTWRWTLQLIVEIRTRLLSLIVKTKKQQALHVRPNTSDTVQYSAVIMAGWLYGNNAKSV